MTTQTSLLRLILPVQGEFSGTWGDQVNAGLTNLLDTAIAGTTTLSTDADVTLTTANFAADQARAMILFCTGARTATRNINAPLLSKAYVVINATSFPTVLRGTTPTTGVTIPATSSALCAWNGSDFVVVATNNISSNITGVLPVANGGTGVTTSTGSGSVVLSTSPSLTTPALGTPASGNLANCTFPTLNQNTTGTASNVTGVVAVANGGTGASTAATAPFALKGANADITSLSGLTTALSVAQGGTGVTTSTGSGSVVLSTSPSLTSPVLGTPTSGNLANCTFPTLNQNTTGTATNATNVAVTAQSASATYQLVGTSSTTSTNAALSISSTTKPLTFNPSTGDFTAAGNVTAYSDESLKKDWTDLAGDFVSQLAGVKSGAYTRIDGGERQVGVSAQSLQAVLPEAVVVGGDGLLSVAYGNAALAACVMLARKVAELEDRLAKIEG